MNPTTPIRLMRFGWKAATLALTGLLATLANSPAQVWTNLNGGTASGLWNAAANWSPNAVPNAQDAIADFSTLAFTGNSTITNGAPVTVGTLLFANAAANGATLTLDGPGGNLITLDKSSGIPAIGVTNVQVHIGGLSGSQGFEKTGNGSLAIYGATYGNGVSGTIYVNQGLLGSVNGQSFQGITGDIIVANGASFSANAKFDGYAFANNFVLNGTGGSASGYVNNANTPDGIYNGEPQPMGALDLLGNATLNGTITLGSDAKITHGYNFAWVNAPVGVTNAGQNLELATTVGSGAGGASMFMQQAITLGTGSLTISGIGASSTAVVLIGGFYGSNSYAGGTIISSGNLVLAGGYPATMDTTSGLTFTGSGGSLDLGGNTQTLPFLTGSSGTIIGNDSGSGSPTLTVDQSINTSFAGGFADGTNGVLSLVKQGTGSLTVGGMSSHSGPTTISAGRLLGGSGGGMTNSVIEIASGATNGYVATVPNGQWVGKELVYNAGTTYIQYDFGGQTVDAAYQAPILVNGNVTINGTLNFAIKNGIWLQTGVYPLLAYTGTLTPSSTVNLIGLPAGVSATLTNDLVNKRFALVVTTIPPIILPGVTNGVWTSLAYNNAPATNGWWSLTNNWSGGVVASGASAIADFSTLGIATNSLVTNDAPKSIGTLLFANTDTNNNAFASTKTWTLYGGSVNKLTLANLTTATPVIQVNSNMALVGGLLGSQGFIKKGNGTLAIVGDLNNTVTGPITVEGGILGAATGKALGGIAGPITVQSGATMDFSGNFDGTSHANNITLNGTGVGAIPAGYIGNAVTPDGKTYQGSVGPLGAIDIHGNATLSGSITLNTDSRISHSWNNGTINGPIVAAGAGKNLTLRTTVSGQGDLFVGGSLSLGSGALTITGTGTQGVRLNNSNNFSGGTYLTAGKLRVGNLSAVSGGALTLTGGFVDMFSDLVVSQLSGATNTTIGSSQTTAGTYTLTVTQSVATIFLGSITNGGGTRLMALTKDGTGELALAGTNRYSGATLVSAGQLMGVTGGSCSNSVIQIVDGATNGVKLASAGGQWVCAGLTYDFGGNQSVVFDFNGFAPSTTTAPLYVTGGVAFDGTVTVRVPTGWGGTNTYPLITASGGITGTTPSVALPPSMGGNLQVIGNTLYLNVTSNSVAPTPTILPVYNDGLGNLVIRTATMSGYNYLLLSTTNLTPPVIWVTNSTTVGTGGIITNTVPVTATPPNQFFRYQAL